MLQYWFLRVISLVEFKTNPERKFSAHPSSGRETCQGRFELISIWHYKLVVKIRYYLQIIVFVFYSTRRSPDDLNWLLLTF